MYDNIITTPRNIWMHGSNKENCIKNNNINAARYIVSDHFNPEKDLAYVNKEGCLVVEISERKLEKVTKLARDTINNPIFMNTLETKLSQTELAIFKNKIGQCLIADSSRSTPSPVSEN